MTDKQCGCQTQGIAILPVRYTVIPNYLNVDTPLWANLDAVTKVRLAIDYKYHVRSLRSGFLYIYLPNEIGDEKWQIYTIDNNGNLFKQHSINTAKTAKEIENEGGFRCPNLANNPTHNKFITIPNPEEQKKIYIAFSEFIWTDELIEICENNPEQRMQSIDTKDWKGNQEKISISATNATQKNIEQILDFNPTFEQTKLPYDDNEKVNVKNSIKEYSDKTKLQKHIYNDNLSYDKKGINQKTGVGGFVAYGFDNAVLNNNTTCIPWTKQLGQAKSVAYTMKRYCQGYSPVLIAIDDPVGIAYELNGYFTEIYAKDSQYRQERELEFDSLSSYEFATQILIQQDIKRDLENHYSQNPYFEWIMQNKQLPDSSSMPVFSIYNQLSILINHELYGKTYAYRQRIQMLIGKEFDTLLPPIGYGKSYYQLDKNYFLYGKNKNCFDREGRTANAIYPQYMDLTPEQKVLVTNKAQSSIEQYANMLLNDFDVHKQDYINENKSYIDSIYQKYSKCLNPEHFNKQYKSLQDKISEIATERAIQNIEWILKSSFYQHMKDLDGNIWYEVVATNDQTKDELDNQAEIDLAKSDNDIIDEEAQKISAKVNPYGVIYSEVVDRCTAGLELTEIGKKQIELLFNHSNAKKDTSKSIMLRGLANNNDMILKDIQTILEKIENTKEDVKVDEVYGTTKLGKLAAYYKKIQGFTNAVQKYEDELKKAKEAISKNKSILKDAKKLGIKIPNNDRLLKIMTSNPMLKMNNLALRFANQVFHPLNMATRRINASLCFMFHGSLFGIPKYGTKIYCKSVEKMNDIILNTALQMGEPGNSVRQLTSEEKDNILNYKKQYKQARAEHNRLNELKFNEKYADTLTKLKKSNLEDIETVNIKEPNASKGFKDVRLALFIAIFEVYNWGVLFNKRQELKNDDFWNGEMIGSTLALSAIASELLFQFTKVSMGSETVIAGRMKVLSGFLGATTGLFVGVTRFLNSSEELSQRHYGLAILNFINGGLYFINAGLSFGAAVTYHVPWMEGILLKRAIRNQFVKEVVNHALSVYAVQYLAKRVALLGTTLWIGIIIMLLDVLIEYLTDNDLEKYLKYSALGTENQDSKSYATIEDQQTAFKKVLKDTFGITESMLQSNNQNNNQSNNQNNNQQKEQSNNKDFTEEDALLLIKNDFKKQKAYREGLLTDIAKQKALAELFKQQYEYNNVNGYSIGDIFSGKMN